MFLSSCLLVFLSSCLLVFLSSCCILVVVLCGVLCVVLLFHVVLFVVWMASTKSSKREELPEYSRGVVVLLLLRRVVIS